MDGRDGRTDGWQDSWWEGGNKRWKKKRQPTTPRYCSMYYPYVDLFGRVLPLHELEVARPYSKEH